MKKFILSTTATMLLAVTGVAHAGTEKSYLTDGSNNIITNGTNLCWETSGDKIFSAACGNPAPVAPAPVAAPAPQLPKVVVHVKKQVEIKIDLEVLFGFDSSKLSDKAKSDLRAFASSYTVNSVKLVGHSDQIGANNYNSKLGLKRAENLKSFLVELGIPAAAISTSSVGKAEPAVECKPKTIACEAPNRRVQVEALGFKN